MSRLREKITVSISLPKLVGAAAACVVAAWQTGVTAAEHVMAPHIAESRVRVQVMCSWAKGEEARLQAICEAVGAKCPRVEANPLLERCEKP